MRWSATLIPTLKQDPADAVARSHRLMLRAGMVRQVGSGCYSYLPLGLRALQKAADVVRQEMNRVGALEVLMPILWTRDLMDATGRLEAFSDDLFQFVDRRGRDLILAPTHEEVVTGIARDEVRSYRQLPLILYQIGTKLRDEPRPRFGVIRTREFIMKDAYSFSADESGLDDCYETMRAAYGRILQRCGLPYVAVEASSGAMGGGESEEFMVPSDMGTSTFVQCTRCGYAASVEAAAAPAPTDHAALEGSGAPREVDTPGRTSIDAVGSFLGVHAAQMIKTLIYLADGGPVAALVRGDHDVNEDKLRRELGVRSLALADPRTIEEVTGAPVGFAGPVGLEGLPIIADHAVGAVTNAVTGANKADTHLVGVVPGRDFRPERTADIRFVTAEDPCVRCGAAIGMLEGIEVGHVFKLGTRYSDALGATFSDADGGERPFVMGCYGIGINRLLAAAVETMADERGIVWPPALAPYEVLVLPLDVSDETVAATAEDAYRRLCEAGLDALLDDRDERAGFKFKDADLIGIPVRVVVGSNYMRTGRLEVQVRRDDRRIEAAPDEVATVVKNALDELAEP